MPQARSREMMSEGVEQTPDVGGLAQEMMESVATFLRREILHGPLCKDDTYTQFIFEEEQHGPCFFG